MPKPTSKQMVIKFFDEPEISRAIVKLERRISDVSLLDPYQLVNDRATRETVQNRIRDTVREIFGPDSSEAYDFENPSLYYSDNTVREWDDDGADEWQNYGRGIPQMITRLKGLIDRLEEKRMDLAEDPTAQAFEQFKGMQIHARIAAVCSDLFRDGHYPQAVFDASKALVNFVKEKSGQHDIDGVSLMTTVFSVNSPILRFNELQDQSDKDEQQGMMHLFMGATLGVRNPRGHSFLTDSPDEALEFIGLMSLLANRLEKTSKQ